MKQEEAQISAIILVAFGFATGIAVLYFKSRSSPGVISYSRTMRRHPGVFGKKSVHWGKVTVHVVKHGS
ncbi:hypothetical protein TWF506_002816 [Arthrobotrys conoides]|uniref:Uncharacterized protein n=1 Tax=Arthrobotrys conoides TaxID=74498 RepID=A0AAN8N4K9_9PEZI